MTLSEIITFARRDFLNDIQFPYKWSDTILAQYAKMAQIDAVERGYVLVKNPDTTMVTAADVSAGTATSTTANKLVDTGAAFTSAYVSKTVYNTTDDTFATVTALDNSTTLSLSADIMASGETYIIGDNTKALTRICLVAGQAKYQLSAKVQKIKQAWTASSNIPMQQKPVGWLENYYSTTWRSSEGTPLYYVEDRGEITIVPIPASNINAGTGKDTMFLSVYTLPLVDLSLSLNNSPEIPEEYHFDLIDGICALAYSRDDFNKAQWHEANFTRRFGPKLSGRAKEALREMESDFHVSQPSMIY